MRKSIRKIKRGKAKDYQRDAKYYDYFYIRVNNRDITLNMNGWTEGEPIRRNKNGDFVVVEGKEYYLDNSNI